MKKVITYGTYDLLHYGHVKLLERAKALGDYLVVGVTADTFDHDRGKINVQQTLMERIEAVKGTGLADEIIIEEYEGQKIDDIKRFDIDIFAIGSDWEGKFDYLKDYCEVVYLERTQGVSSTNLRSKGRELRLGLVGESPILNKFERESHFVNGISISGICTSDEFYLSEEVKTLPCKTNDLQELLFVSDAVYIISHPSLHYEQIKLALQQGKHVLCESPITLHVEQWDELQELARQSHCVLMDSLKTAYSTAYYRLLLLAKSGKIGKVISVDAVCTSMENFEMNRNRGLLNTWNSICAWGPTALLPIFQLLGYNYVQKNIVSHLEQSIPHFDLFTKIAFVYPHAVASLKVGQGVKSEGELIISGTKGYIYVPAPWWKTDYFEIRYENSADNRRYFYQLDGEGIRYELVSFVKSIQQSKKSFYLEDDISKAIVGTISDFYRGVDLQVF
jgi:choline-phosphate cytidylyltransferase